MLIADPKTPLSTRVTEGRDEVVQVFFVLEAGVIHDAVADLTLECPARGERFYKKHRILIRNDVFECVWIGETEPFSHLHFVAVFVAVRIEPALIFNTPLAPPNQTPVRSAWPACGTGI